MQCHCGDKTILRPSYLHNGISNTGKMCLYIESGPWSTDVTSNHRNPENLKRKGVYNFIIRTMTVDGLAPLPLVLGRLHAQ